MNGKMGGKGLAEAAAKYNYIHMHHVSNLLVRTIDYQTVSS